MNDISKYPAVARALKFLRLNLQNGTWPPGCRLPVHKALAKMAGVSQTSLSKALAILRREELVNTIPGGWIMAGKPADAPVPPPQGNQDRKKWQRLKRRLEGDIFLGEFTAGNLLPPLKILAEKYNVASGTLKKAVDSLVDDGILVWKKSRACVFSELPLDGQSRIIVLGRGLLSAGFDSFVLPGNPVEEAIIHELDAECRRVNAILTPICFGPTAPASLQRYRGEIRGVIVIPAPEVPMRQLRNLLSNHIDPDIPVSIFNPDGELHKNLADCSGRRIRFFRLAGRSSGNAVGKYLLSMGHRRIACISQFSREKFGFVAERFAGLVLAWRSARLPISRITFRCPESNGLTPSAPPAATKAMAAPASGILTKPQMEMIFDELRQDTDITAWVTINDNLMQQVYKYFGSLLPNGVSLVSFDDLPEAVYFGVTSFNFNHSRLAGAMLAAILSPPSLDKSMGETLIEQPGQLIVRRSVYHVPAIS